MVRILSNVLGVSSFLVVFQGGVMVAIGLVLLFIALFLSDVADYMAANANRTGSE